MSGISGAGRNASEKLLYCRRNENASAYGLPKHRHLSEIEEQLSLFANQQVVVSFHHLAPMNRGICTTISVPTMKILRFPFARWNQEYEKSSFVNVLPLVLSPRSHMLLDPTGLIFPATDSRTNQLVICSTEDNLIKGAVVSHSIHEYLQGFAEPDC